MAGPLLRRVRRTIPIVGGGGISFVGSKFIQFANSATAFDLTTLLNNAGGNPTLQADDFVMIAYALASASDRDIAAGTPAGWTIRSEIYSDGTSFDSNLAIFWKKMGGSPDTSVTLPGSGGASEAVVASGIAFRGVHTTTPFDVADTTQTSTGSGRPNFAPITPVTAGAIIVASGMGAAGAIVNAFTNPGDLSAGTNEFPSDFRNTGTNRCVGGMGFITGWVSGALDPSTWTSGPTGAAQSYAAITSALRPA